MQLTDHECQIARDIIDPTELTVSWESIGGLDDVVAQLREAVVLPFARPDIFQGRLAHHLCV